MPITQTERRLLTRSTSGDTIVGEIEMIPGTNSTITTTVPPANLTQVEVMRELGVTGITKVTNPRPTRAIHQYHLRLLSDPGRPSNERRYPDGKQLNGGERRNGAPTADASGREETWRFT